MPSPLKVAVIGAGVSGLVAARELQREGHDVVVFEKSNHVGGTWFYDPKTESDPLGIDPTRDPVHGSLYLSLRTNLPRQLMDFSDYPFAKRESGDPRTFPGHEEVLRFLEDFAGEFGIRGLTRFETEVVKVERKGSEWTVESRTSRLGDSVSREEFDAVVVCSGHFSVPKLGEVPGIDTWRRPTFIPITTEFLNLSRIRHVVILIGLGPSSFDLSREISQVAKEVHVATRLSSDSPSLKFENYQNITFHTTIKRVYEDGLVAFEDGFSVYADAIIHCTGYKYDLPFLVTNGTVTVEDNRVGPLYKHVFPPALAPWLSFIGLTSKDPVFHIIELQCKWVARVLSGKIMLPTEEEMMESVKEYYQLMEKNGLPKHYTHFIYPLQGDYKHWLIEQLGLPALKEWKENMYEECIKNLDQMNHSYRDQWDDIYWDNIIQSSQN
ncbi:hypothetical protein Fmac_025481 [Flemingia macrophylla]|uniref:Flavin-containing monooxygenase n=1 Tax=Flemingia macrophylla TaxID=520843 RepID=A0ABD1LSD3_9FABA